MTHVRVLGADLYSEVIGHGDPVVLLHGGFATLEQLRPLADLLADSFTVYSYERPGHGRSADIDGPYDYAASAAEAVAYLDTMNLTTAHLVGFSDGAVIALMVGIDHPQRLKSLVAISANLSASGFIGTADEIDADEWSAGIRPALDLHAALSPDDAHHAEVVLAKLTQLWAAGPNIDAASLAHISVPTLIMSGEYDTIRPDHSQLIASSIPDAQLHIVAAATHELLEQQPAHVFGTVAKFLATTLTSRP